MCEKTCNYSNFPTFTLALYFSSDREGATRAENYKQAAYKQALNWHETGKHIDWNMTEKVKFGLAELIKHDFWDVRDYGGGIDVQMMGAAYSLVDWQELAEDILND